MRPRLVAAHHHRHARARVGEVHHRLPGRVARADHDHVVAAALGGLAAPRPVVDAALEQLVDARERQPAPDHPGGGEHHVCGELVAAGEREALLPGGRDRAADDAALQDQLGAEALRLAAGEPGELRAADAVDEAEEVLDQRRCATPVRRARPPRSARSTARRMRRRRRRRVRRVRRRRSPGRSARATAAPRAARPRPARRP